MVLFILFSSLFIISIRLSIDKTITSVFDKALTVAVLSSSLRRAISPKIFPAQSSATFVHFIHIATLHFFIIYHSPFEASHSIIIISHSENVF